MKRAQQRGFTLVEMMVSLAILAIVTIVMASTFLVGYKTISNEARVIAANTAVSDASMPLLRDLNSANVLPAGTITSGSPALSFTYGSPAVTVTYTIDGNNNLIRSTSAGSAVAGRGISSLAISVSGCYATLTIQPSASGASSQTLNISNRPGGCF
jgi:prepilin-type N-terminal cleavage/methylation domain-containing protein